MTIDLPREKRGVSVITCTKRIPYMKVLFGNYARQNYRVKELIVILNDDDMELEKYVAEGNKYRNVRVYRLREKFSLGYCLNYGVGLAQYGYIAKFDDDDYYAPNYLTHSIQTLRNTHADIVGKRAHYMYLHGRNLLLLRYYHAENQYVSLVQGATLVVKRRVFQQVAFPNQSRGECVKFCLDCFKRGFKIYSGSKDNFAAIRRRRSKGHTWIVTDKHLLSQKNVQVFRVNNFREFVSRR